MTPLTLKYVCVVPLGSKIKDISVLYLAWRHILEVVYWIVVTLTPAATQRDAYT